MSLKMLRKHTMLHVGRLGISFHLCSFQSAGVGTPGKWSGGFRLERPWEGIPGKCIGDPGELPESVRLAPAVFSQCYHSGRQVVRRCRARA